MIFPPFLSQPFLRSRSIFSQNKLAKYSQSQPPTRIYELRLSQPQSRQISPESPKWQERFENRKASRTPLCQLSGNISQKTIRELLVELTIMTRHGLMQTFGRNPDSKIREDFTDYYSHSTTTVTIMTNRLSLPLRCVSARAPFPLFTNASCQILTINATH